jgi:DNA helicase II / ATP-dependent DNA helicase PcrA
MDYTMAVNGRDLTATDEQAEIIDFVRDNPRRHVLINALAGAAKTSTLRFLCKYLPVEPTLSVAFNKRIADEMGRLLPSHVRCATMNSVGHRVWGAAVGKRLILETKKNFNLVKNYIDNHLKPGERREAYEIFSDLTKALSKAKLNGYVPSGVPVGRSLISEEGFFGGLEETPDDWFIDIVNHCLRESIAQAYGGLVDFDDQIYMSTLFGGSFPSHVRVMVDETQDLSPLNHAMVTKLVSPTSQLIAVGDPWQSIYAFRGADTQSMSGLSQRFDMHEMTLSISFRCPRSVVRNAHDRVPHMRWPDWAIEGTVEALPSWSAKDIPDGAAIICRNNAPLLSTALALLKASRGVHLVGTDLGPQLVKTLKKLSPRGDLPRAAVHDAIDAWEQEKMRKARDSGTISDRADCLRVFANFGDTLGAAITYCELLFSSKGPVQLLSGHKAKGLEWDTVYHLDPHRIPSPWAKEGEALEQELNVRYVIETRAKRALYFVRLEDLDASGGPE